MGYLPSFGYKYDGWDIWVNAFKQYILEKHNSIKPKNITGDVDYDGNEI